MSVIDLSAAAIRRHLDFPSTVDALAEMFRSGCEMPPRPHYTIKVPGGPDATLILMPAWIGGAYMGVKVVNIFPGNSDRGQDAVNAVYLLFSAETGEMRATLDGGELTARRTAAASALAARYLARKDARRLLIAGTGRMSRNLARAHAAVRPIREIRVWGRNPDKAAALARDLSAEGFDAAAAADLAAPAAWADLISCATLSPTPLIRGEWLRPGTHVDLVGGYTPQMREADDATARRASIFVDTRAGALAEAGDIVIPLANGTIRPESVLGDLADLTRGAHPGRRRDDEITLFKSVGAAGEDLAAAALAVSRAR